MATFDNESFGTKKKKKKNYQPPERWFESFDEFDRYHASYGDDRRTIVLVLSDLKNPENEVKTIKNIKWVLQLYIKFKDWKAEDWTTVVKKYNPTNIVIDCESATINEEVYNELWKNHFIEKLEDNRYGI